MGAHSAHGASQPASGLDFLSRLLTDRALLRDWLDRCAPDVRRPFTRATLLVAGLQANTEWPVPAILDTLRCDKRKARQLDDLGPAQLEHCVACLASLVSLSSAAPDDRFLRRATVSAMADLYWSSGCDLDACAEAIHRPIADGDPTTPRDLVALGEIRVAFTVARARVAGKGETVAGRSGAAHLSRTTTDALLRYSNVAEQHGMSVSQALALLRHIDRCDRCRALYERRSRALGLPVAETAHARNTLRPG